MHDWRIEPTLQNLRHKPRSDWRSVDCSEYTQPSAWRDLWSVGSSHRGRLQGKQTSTGTTHTHTRPSCCIVDLDISSYQRPYSSWRISTWQKAQFGWTSENLKTIGKPRQHLAGNLEVFPHGIYIWPKAIDTSWKNHGTDTRAVLQLSRYEIWFLYFQMPDVPCGLSSLTHTVWHMTHLTLFSLQHATLCVLMHNEKWLKTMFHCGACCGSSRAEHIGEIQVILLKPCFKELTDRPPVCCVTSVH